MEENIKQLNDKLNAIELRLDKLEKINKRRVKIKIITSIITMILVIVVGIAYAVIISSIYNNYTNLF